MLSQKKAEVERNMQVEIEQARKKQDQEIQKIEQE
jgi:hypothetical protein